jgi:hypothetical protein
MNIKVTKVKSEEFVYQTGGGYAETTRKITIDTGLPLRCQVENVVHEIIEPFIPCLSHEKIEELDNLIREGLDELDWPE